MQGFEENQIAFVMTNFNDSSAGTITGRRDAAPSGLVVAKNMLQNLGGDAAFFNFFDLNASRLVLRQYTYSTEEGDLEPNRIIDPQGNWGAPLASKKWTGVANLHGVAAYNGKWLYATGYDLANISIVNMDNNYEQVTFKQFPEDFSTFPNPYADGVYHGEALQVVGNSLYALFYVNKGSGYSVYYNSVVVKFNINRRSGELSFDSYVTVGKNSFTLDLYDNKLYVCSLGGMQGSASYNAETNLAIVDLEQFEQAHVQTVAAPSPQPGDYRDISILDANNVYIFMGYYGNGYGGFVGKVYHTTLANITNTASWTPVIDFNDGAGFLWGIHADGHRLWFFKGTPIQVFDGTPTTLRASADRTFTAEMMGDYGPGGNMNSVCFIAPDKGFTPVGRSTENASMVTTKSMAPQIRLAKEARMLAAKLKEENK